MKLPRTRYMFPGSLPALLERDREGGFLAIVVECPECAKRVTRMLSPDDADKVVDWYSGTLDPLKPHVQDVFPDWTPEERETFLMTHYCKECWNRLMGG